MFPWLIGFSPTLSMHDWPLQRYYVGRENLMRIAINGLLVGSGPENISHKLF